MVCRFGDILNSELGMIAVGLVLLEKVAVPAVVLANKDWLVTSDCFFAGSFAAKPGCIGLPARNPPTKTNPHMPAETKPESAGRRSIAAHSRCNHGAWVMASSKLSNRAVSPARNRAVTRPESSLK